MENTFLSPPGSYLVRPRSITTGGTLTSVFLQPPDGSALQPKLLVSHSVQPSDPPLNYFSLQTHPLICSD